MYNINRLFVGIPLNQFNETSRPNKSKNIINELNEILENSFSIDMIDNYIDAANSVEVKTFFRNFKDLYYGNSNEDFSDFIVKYKLSFESGYNGAAESPFIFGFYIDNLLPINDFEITKLNVDIQNINLLKDRFTRLAYNLFGDESWNKLNADELIGVFFNSHSS